MQAKELLQYQLEDTGYQIERILDEFPESAINARLTSDGMSAAEIITHLCEAYVAYIKQAEGKKHQWGSYRSEEKTIQGLLRELRQTRRKAVETALFADNKAIYQASDYIIGHDYYHIGQLALLRLKADPAWNANSIYRFYAEAGN